MPRSPSPPRGPRKRSLSPRRDRDRDHRPRSRSPPRGPIDGRSTAGPPRRTKELSFYKKSNTSLGSLSSKRDPLEEHAESERERFERRDRGEVPSRFGGTREAGVRNTMSREAPIGNPVPSTSMGSFRRGNDPLDRMPVKGAGGGEAPGGYGSQRDYDRERERRDRDKRERRDGDKQREERVAAMDKSGGESTAPPAAGRPLRFIEVIANDRMGRKVRIKCLPTDTVGDLKRLIAAQTGTSAQKIQLKKWYTSFKDHVTLQDYEINDGMSLEMY